MIPLIVIRPQPGCDATLTAARKMGLEAYGFPLFEIRPLSWQAPDPASFDALLIGSANALRHGGSALTGYRGKPVYAVGKASAVAAHAAGLDVVACGAGGLQSLLGSIRPEHRRLLRLRGREHIALSHPEQVSLAERTVYVSQPQTLPTAIIGMLHQPVIVLMHSAEAARHFAVQCDGHGIARDQLHLVTLGSRISQAAGQGWGSVAAASRPDDDTLLALAQQVCQNTGKTNR
jgi:uroporphyrinogen-III synthase